MSALIPRDSAFDSSISIGLLIIDTAKCLDICEIPTFLTAIRNRLLPQVLPTYEVRVEEYLLLEHDELPVHRIKPDVVVSSNRSFGVLNTAKTQDSAAALVSEAAYPDFDPVVQRRLILTNRGVGRVVTVIEVLSPINKAPGRDGIDSYQRKREEVLCVAANPGLWNTTPLA